MAGAGKQGDAAAVLRGGEGGGQAGHTGADDDDIVLNDFCDLILRDRGGRDLKFPLGGQGLLRGHGLWSRILGQSDAAAQAHHGQARRTGGRALEKVPT